MDDQVFFALARFAGFPGCLLSILPWCFPFIIAIDVNINIVILGKGAGTDLGPSLSVFSGIFRKISRFSNFEKNISNIINKINIPFFRKLNVVP
jgi:hypothetical protein